MKNPGVYRGSKYIDIAIIWPNCFYVAIFERKNLNCSADWKKNHFSEWFWYCNKLIVFIIWQLHVSFLSLVLPWYLFCSVIFFPSIYLVWLFGFMVFNATFNNISVISWRSVLLVEETGDTRGKPQTCHKSLTNFST
jgi:hypothetical protein